MTTKLDDSSTCMVDLKDSLFWKQIRRAHGNMHLGSEIIFSSSIFMICD